MTEQMQNSPIAISPSCEQSEVEVKLRLEGQLKNGASWFYWIAILSLINSILFMSGSTFGFIFGLGITQLFDAIGTSLA